MTHLDAIHASVDGKKFAYEVEDLDEETLAVSAEEKGQDQEGQTEIRDTHRERVGAGDGRLGDIMETIISYLTRAWIGFIRIPSGASL